MDKMKKQVYSRLPQFDSSCFQALGSMENLTGHSGKTVFFCCDAGRRRTRLKNPQSRLVRRRGERSSAGVFSSARR